jgi:hypothetical protein
MSMRTELETCLPLSKIQFVVPDGGGRVQSSFATASVNTKDDHNINGLISNTSSKLFTTFLPLVDTDCLLNRYVLDFYNHGVLADLVGDNGIMEGDLYNCLNDVSLIIRAITTSLEEIGPQKDVLVLAFKQLAELFQDKMLKVFNNRRGYRRKGCYPVHEDNCVVCKHMEEGDTVLSAKRIPFTIRGSELSCLSRMVVFVLKCHTCKKLYVGDSVLPLKEKFRIFVDADGHGDGAVRECFQMEHAVALQVLQAFSNEKDMALAREEWSSKLGADPTKI